MLISFSFLILENGFIAKLIKSSFDFWVKPVQPIANLVAQGTRSRGQLNTPLLENMWRNFDVVSKAYKEGFGHVLPLIALFGKSPDELESLVGEKCWSKLVSNKQYVNIKIAFFLSWIDGGDSREVYLERMQAIRKISQLKATTIVNNISYSGSDYDAFLWADKNSRVSIKSEFREMTWLYKATKEISDLTGFEFDSNWNAKKLLEVNSIYNERVQNKEKFKNLIPHYYARQELDSIPF